MRKQMLSIMLAICMMFMLVPVNAFAEEETERSVFAEGSGTGRDFGTSNDFEWKIDGKYKNSNSYVESTQSKPGIVKDNEYLRDNSSVIRLIRGVKANENGTGIEDNSSDQEFRTGMALLQKSFKLDENPELSAASGIGYQGMENSIAIEMDSLFNGAYYSYENNGFDNQVVLEGHTINYANVGHKERFDHIAILKDGDIKNHLAIRYFNNIVPNYPNFAHGATGPANREDATPTCATRFTDRNVDTRLFTVWVEYKDGKMNVSYANGNFATAIRPAEPQLKNVGIDQNKFRNKEVYIGFTSAVGTSKANHTVHAIHFQNYGEPVTDKAYQTEQQQRWMK